MDKVIQNNAEALSTANKLCRSVFSVDGSIGEFDDEVIVEHYMAVSVNGIPAFKLSCTPNHLTELVLGRLYTERLISGADDVKRLFICGKGNIAEVDLKDGVGFKPYSGAEPTCCTGNRQYLDGVRELNPLTGVQVDPKAVFELADRFREDNALHKSTGGTHSCYIRFEDGSIEAFEDIGRHNALDKAVGHMLLEKRDAKAAMLYTTGRVAADMAIKTIAAGIPVLISKSVPTTEALNISRTYNLELICKAWPDSYSKFREP